MTYFRELPDLEYQSFLADKRGSGDYLTVKNLFRRVKIRDELQKYVTLFQKYQIPDNSRPELVAQQLYGSVQYDWVVLISAGITRVRDQWPLSDRQIYDYALNVYGEHLNDVHHYETIEVRDSNNKLILPAGKIVDSNFKISYFDNNVYYTNDSTSLGGNTLYIQNPFISVSNYSYEVKKNNEKRGIYVLNPRYLRQFINDTRQSLFYEDSSQYVSDRLIKTENTRASNP